MVMQYAMVKDTQSPVWQGSAQDVLYICDLHDRNEYVHVHTEQPDGNGNIAIYEQNLDNNIKGVSANIPFSNSARTSMAITCSIVI